MLSFGEEKSIKIYLFIIEFARSSNTTDKISAILKTQLSRIS